MQHSPLAEDRKVIPRWRSLQRTPIGELIGNAHQATSSDDSGASAELSRAEGQWRSDRDAFSALEFVSAAVGFNEPTLAKEAAESLLSNPDVVPGAKRLAQAALGVGPTRVGGEDRVRSIRRSLNRFPRNATLRTELALEYANRGQKTAAVRQMRIAVSTTPTNRFVLRSATRCLVHAGDPEEALWMLERGDPTDPWIASAKLATSDMIGRLSAVSSRRTREVLSSGRDPTQLAELAVGLATLEMKSGNLKRGRKLISSYSGWLNENAAAQARWLGEHYGVTIPLHLEEIDRSFEADAMAASEGERWDDAISSALMWLDDEPFAPRAAVFGSYISSEFLGDFSRSLEIVERGLVANPADVILLNNRAYDLSELGRLSEARESLDKAFSQSPDDNERVVLEATHAHLMMRGGQLTDGLNGYVEAARKAAANRRPATREAILLHLVRELQIAGIPIPVETADQLTRFFTADGKGTREGRRLFKGLLKGAVMLRADDYPSDALLSLVHETLRSDPTN